MFLAFPRLHHCSLRKILDEGEAHFSNGCSPVQASLLLHLHYDMLDAFLFVFVKAKGILHHSVSFNYLGGGKTERDFRLLCMVLN